MVRINTNSKIMPTPQNFNRPNKKSSNINFLVIGLFIIAILIFLGYLPKRDEKVKPVPQAKNIKTADKGIPTQAGYFTISSQPTRINFTSGQKNEAEVKILVRPFDNFKGPVTFSVNGVIKNGRELKNSDALQAVFKESRLENAQIHHSISLMITSSPNLSAGDYAITYSVKNSEIEKMYIVPIKVN